MFGNNYTNPYNYGGLPMGQNYGSLNQQYYNMNMQGNNEVPMQGVKFVTEDEAKAFIVMPNQRVMLMDKNNSLFYIKSADSLGQSTLETYEFKKVDKSKGNDKEETKPIIDTANFVKKDEITNLITTDKLNEELKVVKTDLSQKIEELKKSINLKKYFEGELKDV